MGGTSSLSGHIGREVGLRHVSLCTERDQKVGRAQSTTREPYHKMRLMEKGCHPVDMVETVAWRTSASGGGKDEDGLRQRCGKFWGRDIYSQQKAGVDPRVSHMVPSIAPSKNPYPWVEGDYGSRVQAPGVTGMTGMGRSRVVLWVSVLVVRFYCRKSAT